MKVIAHAVYVGSRYALVHLQYQRYSRNTRPGRRGALYTHDVAASSAAAAVISMATK